MVGGETFVPKIPSIRILDLAKAMNPTAKLKMIGLRPGEKIHELMCPNESYSQTLEYKKYFVIFSADSNIAQKVKLINKKTREKGKKVKQEFEYSSGSNNKFLSIKEIKKLNSKFLE